ncbi:hypothetical protein RDWZM_007915 [Blomia tropicalis]|uniref:C2H2-type domain-containing protein n=1 Tax=Blomia tropicalis TaxID=40697 RepID=A0A9Q0RIE4_BLOTA|nr:hypothetical protein RDWZM_007915 [Blomia tropicalis]
MLDREMNGSDCGTSSLYGGNRAMSDIDSSGMASSPFGGDPGSPGPGSGAEVASNQYLAFMAQRFRKRKRKHHGTIGKNGGSAIALANMLGQNGGTNFASAMAAAAAAVASGANGGSNGMNGGNTKSSTNGLSPTKKAILNHNGGSSGSVGGNGNNGGSADPDDNGESGDEADSNMGNESLMMGDSDDEFYTDVKPIVSLDESPSPTNSNMDDSYSNSFVAPILENSLSGISPGSQLPNSSTKMCVCHLCHLTFTAYSSLRRHMTRHYADRERYECDICLKSYSRKDYLKEHKKLKHSDVAKVMSSQKSAKVVAAAAAAAAAAGSV